MLKLTDVELSYLDRISEGEDPMKASRELGMTEYDRSRVSAKLRSEIDSRRRDEERKEKLEKMTRMGVPTDFDFSNAFAGDELGRMKRHV
jgi:hypothetical protein